MFRVIWLPTAVTFFCFACPEAVAQIDHRVDHRTPGMTGRLLDRNPGTGSFGINPRAASQFDAGLRANAIISGNVTGLGGFHAFSPVLQNNRFRASLPSAGLSRFVGQSVGFQDVRSRRALRPTYYLGADETVSDLGFIRSGLNVPGSSRLQTPLTRPPQSSSLGRPVRPLKLPNPADTRLYIGADRFKPGIRQRVVAPRLDALDSTNSLTTPYLAASASSIFGAPTLAPSSNPPKPGLPGALDAPTAYRLDQQISPLLRPRPPGEESTLESIGRDRSLTAAERILGRRREQVDRLPADARKQLPAARFDRGSGTAADRPAPRLGRRPDDRSPERGGDLFADLYRAVEALQSQGGSRIGFLGRTNPPAPGEAFLPPTIRMPVRPSGASAEAEAAAAKQASQDQAAASRGRARLATAARWALDRLDDPVTSFVGKYEGRLNKYLATAEASLRAGRFYSAAREFDLAFTVDPRNPLPLLGKGHALLAAGDYVSGELAIERGIRLFPQIAAFRMDLPALVGRHDVFDIRRADLQKRLAARPNYRLRFLLGYLELYSGLEEEGLRDLTRAAEQAPPGSIIQLFPDLVLGRRGLPALVPEGAEPSIE